MSKSPITCHVLDASVGKPAPGVKVSLDILSLTGQETAKEAPRTLASGETNSDGRCSDLLNPDTKLSPGIYKMTFHSGEYFKSNNVETFYPFVEITFSYTNPDQHYHIPLLISPFSYTTYRGS
ncbi:hydroxyisourate hydrolase [Kwoniella mangroviensis CBS 10435]|uniref:5-hydroxyisourate hydrolase n=1 Tax=Kwoniella mangroviensis CBS 10435 TaxID=1331196 RepID=A0A1B9IRC2_9TREE|nr:hydroxyisourate hydrolase [Kwoniella mangroviensis CBS 10435]